MSCSQLLYHPLNGSLVKLRESRHPPTPLPSGYDINAHCEFHTGAPSHNIDNYNAFRYKVQDLLDSKAISFTSAGHNVNNNSMPPHVVHPANMIQESPEVNRISKVNMIKNSLLVVKEPLLLKNMFPGCTPDCAHCLNTPQGCGKLKKGIQSLIDLGIFLVEHTSATKDVSTLEIPYYLVQLPW